MQEKVLISAISHCLFSGDLVNVAAVAKASVSKPPLSGEDIQRFLRSFEGAAASFAQNDEDWTLWLPEIAASDHPLTPSSQVFFPVILRHGPHAIAIRFLYDCSLGKVRYYTSAIPYELASSPEFENAISELFRHSLPVEPVRERKLGRGGTGKTRKAETAERPLRRVIQKSLAEPSEAPVPKSMVPLRPPAPPAIKEAATVPVLALAAAPPVISAVPSPPSAPAPMPIETKQSVRIEIGPRARSVLVILIVAVAFVILAAACIYAYLQATEDPGVLHHRLQVEEMRLREGR
jgi:hypothetical protein